MIIQKVHGGLGNQMFQYAFAKALSLRNKVDFKLDISEFKIYFRKYELEIFNIEKKYALKNEIPFYERYKSKNKYILYIMNEFLIPLFKKYDSHRYDENPGTFENNFLYKKSGYFDGYFQSEKYFKDYELEIRKDFMLNKELSKESIELLNLLEGKNTVSIHIRRGDYLKYKDKFSLCPMDYYTSSMSYIKEKVKNPIFLFFSDDIAWVKKEFLGKDYIYIDFNKGNDSWQDMILMSRCKYNIIANSTFSRRGAYLNSNKNKIVIAPKKLDVKEGVFNKEFIPENWIRF